MQITAEDVGTQFRTRNGNCVKITKYTPHPHYPVTASNGHVYTKQGVFWYSGGETDMDLVARVVDTICLTGSDIGKKFRTRKGAVITLACSKGHSSYCVTHPYWCVETGQSVTHKGIERASGNPGSNYDLVERVVVASGIEALRATTKPPIKAGHWKTEGSNGANVHTDYVSRSEATIRIASQSCKAADLRQIAEYFTELANQLD